MVLTEKMLEKLAGSIVDQFFTEKIALNDGVTGAAQAQNLNDEQIKRLVEAVNTTAFLRKFNNPEPGADGRVVEFETANPNTVINRMLDSAKDDMDANNVQGPTSVDTNTDLSRDLPVTREASAPPMQEIDAPKLGEARVQSHIVIMRLRKTAEQLKEAEHQARYDFTDATQQLLTRFRRLRGADFETFEKDAFYHLGPPAAPYLQLLRRSLGKDVADYDYADMRKYARVIDTSTPEMQLFRSMMKSSQTITDAQKGQEKVGEHLARIA